LSTFSDSLVLVVVAVAVAVAGFAVAVGLSVAAVRGALVAFSDMVNSVRVVIGRPGNFVPA
jgi:hypothetical protein